jgi:small-conductance mechanosensitive channel/CRP-like cAMP-binding protein
VSRPHFKRRFLILLIAAAVFALLLYAVYAFEQALRTYFMSHMGLLATSESVGTVLNVIKIALCMGLAVVFVRALNEAIFGLNFRFRKRPQAPGLVRNIFSIIAYVLIFVILFKAYYPRVDLGAVFTTSAIFGVILGLALQDTLGNLFAGLSLQADNPFQVGDVIVVGQQKWTGVVEGISWRAVKVRTFSNHVLVLSNSSIAKEAIEVCPKDNLNARLVYFSTLYTDSPARTIHVVREAVREADNVSQMIRPNVRIRNLGESGVEYEVKYWLEDYAKYNDTDALVRQRIWYAFRRAGLSFSFPTRTLHLERKAKSDGLALDGSGFIERLSAVDIFAPLSSEEISRLATASMSHIFAPGETVIRAGDEGSSMFVVHNGRVQVQIMDNGRPRTVAVLNEGDFFGEMALFTGEPRTANVVASEETEVLEIGKQAMKQLFETNPDLVESLSHTIAERRTELNARPENAEEHEDATAGLFASIKRFFGMS